MARDDPFLLQLAEADSDPLGRSLFEHSDGVERVLADHMQSARTSMLEVAEVLGAHPLDLGRDPMSFLNRASVAEVIRVAHLLDVPVCALVDNGRHDALGGASIPCPHRSGQTDALDESAGSANDDALVAPLLAVLLPARAWIREEDAAAVLGWTLQRLGQAVAALRQRLSTFAQIQLLHQNRCLLLRAPLPALGPDQARRLEEHLMGEVGALDGYTLGLLHDLCRDRMGGGVRSTISRWAPLVRLGWLEIDKYCTRLQLSSRIRYSLGLDDPQDSTPAASADASTARSA